MAFLDSGQKSAAPAIDTEGKLRNETLAKIFNVLSSIFPRTLGAFTLSAAATTVVTQPAVLSTSKVFFVPTNAAAAALMAGAKSLYWDPTATVAGASFSVKTADATSAAGTETFAYFIINPV